MAFYTTTATVRTADGLAANYATNTFHFEADDLTALALAHAAVLTFYQAIDINFSSLAVSANGLEVTSYDDLDPTPRPPVLSNVSNLQVGGAAPLPPEVSLVLSFQGDRMAGVPQSRRRGRIYLPFFGETENGTDGRPTPTLVTAVATAGDGLLTASTAAADWTWLIYSRVAPGYTSVTNGWVDNEWDTQRRRGRDATARTVFS